MSAKCSAQTDRAQDLFSFCKELSLPDLFDSDPVFLQLLFDHIDEVAELDIDGREVAPPVDRNHFAHQVVQSLHLLITKMQAKKAWLPQVLLVKNTRDGFGFLS